MSGALRSVCGLAGVLLSAVQLVVLLLASGNMMSSLLWGMLCPMHSWSPHRVVIPLGLGFLTPHAVHGLAADVCYV